MSRRDAKRRLLAFEAKVYNPAMAFLRERVSEDEEGETFIFTDLRLIMGRAHEYFLVKAHETGSVDADPALRDSD